MAITATCTNDTWSQTWTATNKSDAFTSVEIDGGSITRKLGAPSSQTQNTLTYTSDGTAKKIHIGTWVSPASPEAISIPNTAGFGLNHVTCWESAGQLNGYLYFKISVVTESGNQFSFDRALTGWKAMEQADSIKEMGTNAADPRSMGGSSTGQGINTFNFTTGTDTLAIGERIAIELAFDTVGRASDTLNLEYGSRSNIEEDSVISGTTPGAGSYATELILPFSFSTPALESAWTAQSDFIIPWVSGTDTIAWADVGTDWTVAKWDTTGAARYVNRRDGAVVSQMWIFQDDDYLYISTNNIVDGCIQTSDHHNVMLCTRTDWTTDLETDQADYVFTRDITSGTSGSRTPTIPVAAGDGNNSGEYVMQGSPLATYPENWELPAYAAGPNATWTFSSNSKVWEDSVDWRAGGPGATSTAPNPGGSSSGAYSEFKIKKSTLNNWDGYSPLGVIILMQCDVQANGSTMFPSLLGVQIDKKDWPWPGLNYFPSDLKTASTQTSLDEIDVRVLMSHRAYSIQDLNASFAMMFGATF
jgi:hypothetical protein